MKTEERMEKNGCDFFPYHFIHGYMHFNGNGPSVSNYWQHDLHSILNAIYRLPKPISKVFLFNAFFLSAQWAVQIVFYMQI